VQRSFEKSLNRFLYKNKKGPLNKRAFSFKISVLLTLAFHHHFFDLANCLGWVKAFRAGIRAVHNGMTAIKAEWVLEVIKTFTGIFIAAIHKPSIGLKKNGRTKILVAIPPVTWA
jgi:hypothetical protein